MRQDYPEREFSTTEDSKEEHQEEQGAFAEEEKGHLAI